MARSLRTVIIFTRSYPYSGEAEDTFLDPEMKCLSQNFDKIVLVPSSLAGLANKVEKELPNVIVDKSYASAKKSIANILYRCITSFFCLTLYREIARDPGQKLRPKALRRILQFIVLSKLTEAWLIHFVKREKLSLETSLFYAYWFDAVAFGIILAKARFQDISLISRAHGIDLYQDRYSPAFIPFRHESLRRLDFLFLASTAGREYILNLYPEFEAKYKVAPLGVPDPGFFVARSESGIFRMLSCSYVVPVKRLSLLVRAVASMAKQRNNQKFEWYHIGHGPLLREIQQLAQDLIPSNVACCFLGYLPNKKVIEFYRKKPVDVFMQLSETEGGRSVSVMEAQSCGIPVVATSVGGVPEIVTEHNGVLLDANPGLSEIAEGILKLRDDVNLLEHKRRASRKSWETHSNAEKNSDDFCKFLKAM